MTPITILLVDDHPVVRNGLRGMLAALPSAHVVGEAENGLEAVHLARGLSPQVILMDLRMPGMDGVEAITQIKRQSPHCHILVLTTYDGDSDIRRAIEAGAIGYILKDAPREELFRAIETTAQGKSYLAPAVALRLLDQMRAPEPTALSERELAVLERVAHGASNKEIAHLLHISEATVKTHLLHIFTKLEVNDRTQAVMIAVQRGLIKLP
ncbi:MAG TPA: response regulator transcription factor [Anaerolineales bacterium]|nr:response regulator transcription factor [Anaerolineales bacterium]